MADIHLLRQGHPLWENTASFARDCSWRAGPVLAERMRINAFQSWERVIAAEEGGSVIGFCTFTEKDELPDRYGFSRSSASSLWTKRTGADAFRSR